jgi:hypothetical protein
MYPWLLPRILLGAIVKAAAAAVPVLRKDLLEKFDIIILVLDLKDSE